MTSFQVESAKTVRGPSTLVEELEVYASPPLSPPTLRNRAFDSLRGGLFSNHLFGMDGDNSQRKQHDPSPFPSVPGLPRHVVQQQRLSPGRSAERFRQSSAQSAEAADMSLAAHGRSTRLPDFTTYGYPVQQGYEESSLPAGSLQSAGVQYQTPFSPESLRQDASRRQLQQPPSDYAARPPPQQYHLYGPGLDYDLDQQIQPHASYDVSMPEAYQARPSASLGPLPPQLGVPQYFSSTDHPEAGNDGVVSHYLTPQAQPAPYHQQNPLARSSAAQSYSAVMADYSPVGTTENVALPAPAQELANLDAAYGRYQQALGTTFEYARAGRLVEASRSLLEISEWLVGNARELGLLRDDESRHSERSQLWNNFNLCWLALCQKQKDLTQVILETGQPQPNADMLTVEIMEKMGHDLVRLSDQMEPHGLVDYQMGIWEEEILSVLCQCLDLVEGRNDSNTT